MVPSRYLRTYPSGRDLSEPLFDLHREMTRLFDDVVRNSFWPLSAAQQAVQQAGLALTASPRVDLHESDEALTVTVDVPGVQQSDLDVRVEGTQLIICGEKQIETNQRQQNYHLLERGHGRFERSVTLPFAPDPEQAEASYDNGVLTVSLPKTSQAQSRCCIEVQSGQDSQQRGRQRSSNGSFSSERDRERSSASLGLGESEGAHGGSSSRSSGSSSSQKSPASTSSSERKQPQPA